MTNFITSPRLATALEFIFHPLNFLIPWTNRFDYWGYLVMFLESAYLIFSFLPAQSLLFVAGAISASHASVLNIYVLLIGFILMVQVGSLIKYRTGQRLHTRAAAKAATNQPPTKTQRRLSQSQDYFEKYGNTFLIVARFVPIAGLFVPLLAGQINMPKQQFHMFNTIGIITWVSIATLAGFFFGKTRFVENYFTFICIGIAILPALGHEASRFLHEWREMLG